MVKEFVVVEEILYVLWVFICSIGLEVEDVSVFRLKVNYLFSVLSYFFVFILVVFGFYCKSGGKV